MDIRLNKLISEAGICSRREADSFIATGRVTVNGNQPPVGQKINISDIVLVDGERIYAETYIRHQQETKREEDELMATIRKVKPNQAASSKPEGEKKQDHKFGKYNKFAAARHAAKEGGWKPKKKEVDGEKLLKEALQPKFGKSLSRSAVAQRIAANPKSAALRKTSKNNPVNKAKRISAHKYKEEGGKEQE